MEAGRSPDQPSSEWYAARFDIPGVLFEEELRLDATTAAGRALPARLCPSCWEAVTEPVTMGRFLSNAWHSISFARLRLPPDHWRTADETCEGRVVGQV